MATDISELVNIISIFLPLIVLLSYFFIQNKLAHSIAGLLASSFMFGFGWVVLKNEDLNLLSTELFTIFAIGSVISAIYQSWGSWRGPAGGSTAATGGATTAPTRTGPATGAGPGNGFIIGLIQDQGTHHPVPGAAVRDRRTGAHTTTGADGTFRLELPGLGFFTRWTFRRYGLTIDHPHYFIPPVISVNLHANETVDVGIVELRRRAPAVAHPVTTVLLDALGNPKTTNTVFPNDTIWIRFQLAPGLRLAVPLVITGGNPDRFRLVEEAPPHRLILTQDIPVNAVNYPAGTNEVRVSIRVPNRYADGRRERLPFRDIPIRIIPRIQYV